MAKQKAEAKNETFSRRRKKTRTERVEGREKKFIILIEKSC